MLRTSARDLSLVGGLLPLFTREITADPEQHNRARREARIRGFNEMGKYITETRVEAERRKDDELRAKLEGERVAGPLQGTLNRALQPKPMTAARQRSNARPSASATSKENTKAVAHTQRPATICGQDPACGNLATSGAQSSNHALVDPDAARSANLNTHDQTLPETGTVALSESHTSSGLVADPQAPGSSLRELITALGQPKDTAGPPIAHDKTAIGSTDVGADLTPPESMVLTPPGGLTSAALVRGNHSKQRRYSPDAEPPSDLPHRRDFEVKRVHNRRADDGRVSFSVRWKSTWVPLQAIVKGNDDERSYVKADGAPWYIHREMESRVTNGLAERRVRWASTREPLEHLVNAQEAIANYETTKQQASLDDTQTVRQRRLLTFEESRFPRGVIRPQSDEDYAESQRWVAHTWPRIRPHPTLDLYPAIYQIQMELASLKPRAKVNHRGKSYRNFMRQPQVRALQWSENYTKSGKYFSFGRRTRAALFLQVTGELDTNAHCTRCLGEKLAPFVGCVRTRGEQQSWLGGACANCGTQDYSYCCHHKRGLLGRPSYQKASNKTNAGVCQEYRSAPGMLGFFYADDPEDDDSSSSDEDDDSDSDSDDEAGSEDDHSKDNRSLDHLTIPDSAETQQEPSCADSEAAVPSTEAYSSASDTMDPPAVHARRGKLPKISKAHRAARAIEPANTLPTPPISQSSQNSAESNDWELQPKNMTGAAKLGRFRHSGSRPRSNVKSFAEILEEGDSEDDDFRPESIERDMMDLLWRYLTPVPSFGGHHADTEWSFPAVDGGDHVPSGIKRKRRAAPRAPRAKRSSLDPSRQSLNSPASGSSHNLFATREEHPTLVLPPRTFMSVRSRDRMEPNSIHSGCVAGQPCKDHIGGNRPTPRNPLARVYRDSLDSKNRVTVEQAEHILTQCNCYWAWAFTYIWNSWCIENGGVGKQKYSQIGLLLDIPDKLRCAAWECCPRGGREVVELD